MTGPLKLLGLAGFQAAKKAAPTAPIVCAAGRVAPVGFSPVTTPAPTEALPAVVAT